MYQVPLLARKARESRARMQTDEMQEPRKRPFYEKLVWVNGLGSDAKGWGTVC